MLQHESGGAAEADAWLRRALAEEHEEAMREWRREMAAVEAEGLAWMESQQDVRQWRIWWWRRSMVGLSLQPAVDVDVEL